MTPEQIRPAVISWVKSLEPRAPSNAPDQVVDVDNGELDSYLKPGWRFVSIVNAKKVAVRWEARSEPCYPVTPANTVAEHPASSRPRQDNPLLGKPVLEILSKPFFLR